MAMAVRPFGVAIVDRMQNFQQLRVWQQAHAFRLEVHRATVDFPADERFGLRSQCRRSASSVGWNIAEGCGRGTDADFARCLQIAAGSLFECHDQLIQARDLGFVSPEEFARLEGAIQVLRRGLLRLIALTRRA